MRKYVVVLALCGVFVACLLFSESDSVDDPYTRIAIEGSVTFQGVPLKDGQIRFSPIQGTKAPVSGGVIEEGRYSITSKGGIPVGTYRVEITALEPLPSEFANSKQPPAPMDLPPRKQLIPKNYNDATTLERTISENGPTTFDFTIESAE